MSASLSGEVRAEPNLTPLLDVVFQLITFFMLVMNFNADTYDQRVVLPVAASASAPVARPDEDRIVFNIDSDGQLLFNGQVLDIENAIKEIKAQAIIVKRTAERAKKATIDVEKDGLPSTIVIRCDKRTEYTKFYRLLTACQAQGFRKFDLKAMSASG